MADYTKTLENNPVYQEIRRKMRNHRATYGDVRKLAKALGKSSSGYAGALIGDSATEEELMRVIAPIMRTNHGAMTSLVQSVQNDAYRKVGLGLNAVVPAMSNEDLRALVGDILEYVQNGTMSSDVAEKEFTTYAWRQGDAAVDKVVKDAHELGLELTVTRTYDGVGLHRGKDQCQWCLDRAGTWAYKDAAAPGFVFARHVGCECEISVNVEKRIRPR